MTINEAFLLMGEDIEISDGITLKVPALRDIFHFGEQKYLSVVSMLTAEPFDVPWQLHQLGIDYTKIDSFSLFCLMSASVTPENSYLLFGNLDFSLFRVVQQEDKIVLINKNGVVIDENIRNKISEYLRKMHYIPKQQFTSVGNNFAKDMFLKTAKRDIDRAEKKRRLCGEKSVYLPLVSSIVADKGMFYTWENIFDMKISQFFDSIKRIQMRDYSQNLYTGLYFGAVTKTL